jgi:hypothetical protein
MELATETATQDCGYAKSQLWPLTVAPLGPEDGR